MEDTKTRKVSYKGARKKGARGEYLVRDELVKIGIVAKRVPMSGALEWMKGDVAELNVRDRHVHEVKNHEALDLGEWWRQAAVQARGNDIPVLTFMSNRQRPYTVIRTIDFDTLVYCYEQARKELTLNLITLPSRFNFWKFRDAHHSLGWDVYLWDLAGKTIGTTVHPDEELVIVPFAFYLALRRYEWVGR